MELPYCSVRACPNRTGSADGRCDAHRAAAAAFGAGPAVPGPFDAVGAKGAALTPQRIRSEVITVFPDMARTDMKPSSLRAKALAVLDSAVGREAVRRFPSTNLADPAARRTALGALHIEVSEMLRIVPIPVTVAEASAAAGSTQDGHGRSLADSGTLLSFCTLKEWELAQAVLADEAPDGVSYRGTFEEFAEARAALMERALDTRFAVCVAHYPEILAETGHKPACRQTVLPKDRTDAIRRRHAAEEAERARGSKAPTAAAPARPASPDGAVYPIVKALGKLTMAVVDSAANVANRAIDDYHAAAPEREQAKRDQEARDRQRREDKLIRLQTKFYKERTRRWF